MKKMYLLLTALSVLFSVFTFAFAAQAQTVIGHVKIVTQEWGTFPGSPGAREGEIDITGYTYTAENAAHNTPASVQFTRAVTNDATNNLIDKCFKYKESISSAQFEFFKGTGRDQAVYKIITLNNATITKIDQNGTVAETVTLQFQKISTQLIL